MRLGELDVAIIATWRLADDDQAHDDGLLGALSAKKSSLAIPSTKLRASVAAC
jgi:hypothetical protein